MLYSRSNERIMSISLPVQVPLYFKEVGIIIDVKVIKVVHILKKTRIYNTYENGTVQANLNSHSPRTWSAPPS
jgi:hypothetical protein